MNEQKNENDIYADWENVVKAYNKWKNAKAGTNEEVSSKFNFTAVVTSFIVINGNRNSQILKGFESDRSLEAFDLLRDIIVSIIMLQDELSKNHGNAGKSIAKILQEVFGASIARAGELLRQEAIQ